MDLSKIKKQWDEYNEEFNNSDYMDVETHTSMAMQVGVLIKEVERLNVVNDKLRLSICPICDGGKDDELL